MPDFGKNLIAGMEEAEADTQFEGKLARGYIIQEPSVRAIQEELGLSQQAFPSAYRFPVATLCSW